MPKRKRSISLPNQHKNGVDGVGFGTNTFPCSSNGLVVMLIYPGERYGFYGAARIQCLAGDLIVDKFSMPSGGYLNFDSMYLVCAPFRLSRPALFQSPATEMGTVKYKLNRLKYRLKEITPHYERIMDAVGERYPAIVVIDRKPSQTIRVLDQLVQDFFVPSTLRTSCQFDRTIFFKSDYEPYEEVSEKQLQEAMGRINRMRKEGRRCTIIPVGCSGSGKSTLVRHIVNANLQQEGPAIYLLDADVGQTEFTPAGCMSLWKHMINKSVTRSAHARHKCILAVAGGGKEDSLVRARRRRAHGQNKDIPCTHQQLTYPCSYFFGNISPADDTEKYKVIFDRLLNEFQSTSEPGSLLIINTMGWVDGLGCELLNHVFDVAQPQLALKLSADRGTFNVPSRVPDVVSVVRKFEPYQFQQKLLDRHPRPTRLSSSQLRDLAVLAYFAPSLPRPILSSVCDAQPYREAFILKCSKNHPKYSKRELQKMRH
ncbi:hypothetical protein ANCDUO_03978 [Ancylostoma duodenale]|uniref:Clp1 P-loop domain-containing protein n=1 Tax=Ancylostoma duodenale TaxID=51022 RepID=A0A0C2H287_9BILA|nr:hypothetical protein ANCDUO_03978 [Ancylostoma duodenale]